MGEQSATKWPSLAKKWRICILLLLATALSYLYRQFLSVLAPLLQKELHWSEYEYSLIVVSFSIAFCMGLLIAGRLADTFGVYLTYAISVLLWSITSFAHSQASTVLQFTAVRFALGFAEACNFPFIMKVIALWFDQDETAFAVGLANSGANIGALFAPLCIPILVETLGWRMAFVAVSSLGIMWVIAWLAIYSNPEELPESHKAGLKEGSSTASLRLMLKKREFWVLVTMKCLTDPVWGFYSFYIPKFLNTRHGVPVTEMTIPLTTIYIIADIGSLFGGFLSSFLIKKGFAVGFSRKVSFLVFAIMCLPVAVTDSVPYWISVLVLSLAASGHQGFSANLFALINDCFPPKVTATITGLVQATSAGMGMMVIPLVAWQLETTGHYHHIFIACSLTYALATLTFHCLPFAGLDRIIAQPKYVEILSTTSSQPGAVDL